MDGGANVRTVAVDGVDSSLFFLARSNTGTRRRALFLAIAVLLAGPCGHGLAVAESAGVPPQTFVENCDDDGPGSLRDALASAVDGQTVSLIRLACSKITLTSGELTIAANSLYLQGNGTTVSAGGTSRILRHRGEGTLFLSNLVLADGYYTADWIVAGGCIYSSGAVNAFDVTVRDCTIAPSSISWAMLLGGGIFARQVTLANSTVTGNSIVSPNEADIANGAGIYASERLLATRSTISGNAIAGPPRRDGIAMGGGFYSGGTLELSYSAVANNAAEVAGGGAIFPVGYAGASKIINSTISGNHARSLAAGVFSADALMEVWNSTIAFNAIDAPETGVSGIDCGGLLAIGGNEYLSFRSSIVANNSAHGVLSDVCGSPYIAPIIGFDNLITASNLPLPPGTLSDDPRLAPLADNGGHTLTHALQPGGPAIDAGNNTQHLKTDQRGAGRMTGDRADIGAFEVQPDAIFVGDFDT